MENRKFLLVTIDSHMSPYSKSVGLKSETMGRVHVEIEEVPRLGDDIRIRNVLQLRELEEGSCT